MPRDDPGPPTGNRRRLTAFEATLRRIGADLAGIGAGHVVVGGLAVSVRTEPRFTRDVGLAVAVAVADDSVAEAVIDELLQRGYRSLAMVEHEATGRLATARLTSPVDDDIVVDLLLASSGIEPEVVAQADRIEVLPGLVAPVAATGHLITLKLLARDDRTRPQDLVDLRALLAVAGPADLDLVRASAMNVKARGYDRGRDLMASLFELVDGSSG